MIIGGRDVMRGVLRRVVLQVLGSLRFGAAVVLVALVASSCNEYEKLLQSTDTLKQYRMALSLYEKGKYGKAKPLFEKVLPLSSGTRRADTIAFYLSQCYYRENDFELSAFSFKRLVENYPNSAFVEEALFMSGYSSYLSAPRPEIDQSNTYEALQTFAEFAERYPNSTRVAEVKQYTQELTQRLMEKSYLAAILYYKREQYKAATLALKGAIEKYPNTPYREELVFLTVKSAYLLAKNSVPEKRTERYQQVVDESLTLFYEFPNSKYLQETIGYYRKSLAYLGRSEDAEVLARLNQR